MKRYTNYCTEEQIRKAFELGAPIEILPNYTEFRGFPFVKCQDGNERPCVPPTAEQMIGWLEEQEEIFEIDISVWYPEGYERVWCFDIRDKYRLHLCFHKEFESRKEATIAAIDAALEYLIQRKGKI